MKRSLIARIYSSEGPEGSQIRRVQGSFDEDGVALDVWYSFKCIVSEELVAHSFPAAASHTIAAFFLRVIHILPNVSWLTTNWVRRTREPDGPVRA